MSVYKSIISWILMSSFVKTKCEHKADMYVSLKNAYSQICFRFCFWLFKLICYNIVIDWTVIQSQLGGNIYLCFHSCGLSMREIAIPGNCKIFLQCQLLNSFNSVYGLNLQLHHAFFFAHLWNSSPVLNICTSIMCNIPSFSLSLLELMWNHLDYGTPVSWHRELQEKRNRTMKETNLFWDWNLSHVKTNYHYTATVSVTVFVLERWDIRESHGSHGNFYEGKLEQCHSVPAVAQSWAKN